MEFILGGLVVWGIAMYGAMTNGSQKEREEYEEAFEDANEELVRQWRTCRTDKNLEITREIQIPGQRPIRITKTYRR